MAEMIAGILEADATLVNVYTTVFRWIAVALAAFLLFRCMKPLLTFRREPEIWAWLCLENGRKLPITHWENVIGRSKRSDIVIDFPTVSKNHAVLTRYDDGSWTISDISSADPVEVNGEPIDMHVMEEEDVISIGGIDMTLQPISHQGFFPVLGPFECAAADPVSVPCLPGFSFGRRWRDCPVGADRLWRPDAVPVGAAAVLCVHPQDGL